MKKSEAAGGEMNRKLRENFMENFSSGLVWPPFVSSSIFALLSWRFLFQGEGHDKEHSITFRNGVQ